MAATGALRVAPLKKSGALDKYESFMVTPILGEEFPTANVVEMLRAPNSDDIIRDLAITLAERGVIFFRGNTNLDAETHKEFITRLGDLSGRPKGHGLYIHPICNAVKDEDLHHHILDTSRLLGDYDRTLSGDKRQSGRIAWHADSCNEIATTDYTSLRMTTIPLTGGDTLWASGYEVYDRLSEGYQNLLENCTATFKNEGMINKAKKAGVPIFEGPRGAPVNIGGSMEATHPAIRTHPITGWKSVFGCGLQWRRMNGVTQQEGVELHEKLLKLIMENHDLQCRFKWQTPGDFAIWDNRCVWHAPTGDQIGARVGWRVQSIGEVPYLDPASTGRNEALYVRAQAEKAAKLVAESERLSAAAEPVENIGEAINGQTAEMTATSERMEALTEPVELLDDLIDGNKTIAAGVATVSVAA